MAREHIGGSKRENAHGLQRDSDLLWLVHARYETRLLCEALIPLTPTSVPLTPHGQGPQVRLMMLAQSVIRVSVEHRCALDEIKVAT
jgi:hypothetical protein